MDDSESTMAQQVAQAAIAFQKQRTGRAPAAVTVVLSEDTLVITLHGALVAGREGPGHEPGGAAKCRSFTASCFSPRPLAAEGNQENHRPRGARGGRRSRAGHWNRRARFHDRHVVQVFLLDGRLARGAAGPEVKSQWHNHGDLAMKSLLAKESPSE